MTEAAPTSATTQRSEWRPSAGYLAAAAGGAFIVGFAISLRMARSPLREFNMQAMVKRRQAPLTDAPPVQARSNMDHPLQQQLAQRRLQRQRLLAGQSDQPVSAEPMKGKAAPAPQASDYLFAVKAFALGSALCLGVCGSAVVVTARLLDLESFHRKMQQTVTPRLQAMQRSVGERFPFARIAPEPVQTQQDKAAIAELEQAVREA
ncbi:hypothetical protein RI367_006542 [Sorochytrium milnesiophthora]